MKSALDRILEGEDIKAVLKDSPVNESMEKDIVTASNMVSDWLSLVAYDFDIDSRETIHKIVVKEMGPDGSSDEYPLFVRSDGRIYNSNGDDVLSVALDAYDNDPDKVAEIKAFNNKWYK